MRGRYKRAVSWLREKRGIFLYYLAAEGICLGLGMLYRLNLFWQLAMGVLLLFFLPVWRRNYRQGKRQQQRLSDAQVYMEQLLYAFLRQEKLLAAIGEVLVLFPEGKMHDTLKQAVAVIRYDYQEEDAAREALRLIEQEYQNERLSTIHRFLYKVETIGGNYEGVVTLLLKDLNGWRQRMDCFQKDCRRERQNVGIAVVVSLGICMVTTYLLPAQTDISGSRVRMASTFILVGVLLWIYTRMDSRLAVNWLLEGSSSGEPHLADKYRKYLCYQEEKEQKKSLLLACVPFLGIFISFFIFGKFLAVFCILLTIFFLYQHKIGHFLAKRNLMREIQKAFPHWLMELSLLLQTDNVQVAISRTVSRAPDVLQPALEQFQDQIAKEPESADPYLNFLREFSNPQIQSAMKMLYAMSVGTGGSESDQLEELIARNQNLMNQSEELMHEDALAGMYLLFLAPALTGGMKLLVDMTIFLMVFFTGTVMK